jgi:hypothetical protein
MYVTSTNKEEVFGKCREFLASVRKIADLFQTILRNADTIAFTTGAGPPSRTPFRKRKNKRSINIVHTRNERQ